MNKCIQGIRDRLKRFFNHPAGGFRSKTGLCPAWFAAVAALGLWTGGCATLGPAGQRNIYSLQDDIKLGQQARTDLMKEFSRQGIPLNRDAGRVRQLQSMVQRIGAVSRIPSLPFQVTLAQDEMVNALAMPGGHVVVFEGLYAGDNRMVEDEDELAAVVAHEIAHATSRHVTRSLTRAIPVELAMLTAAILSERRDDDRLQTVLGGAMIVYQGIFLTHYSRRDEEEADRFGLEYMARAGYDPAAAVQLWERVAREGKDSPRVMNYLSTHPSAQDRYRNLSAMLPVVKPIYERTRHGNPEPFVRPSPTGQPRSTP